MSRDSAFICGYLQLPLTKTIQPYHAPPSGTRRRTVSAARKWAVEVDKEPRPTTMEGARRARAGVQQ